MIKVLRQACKPSSVWNGHLSRPAVACKLKRLHGARRAVAQAPTINLAPDGVYRAAKLPRLLVSSYLTFSPLPSAIGLGRYISVALSLESPPPGVTRRPALRSSDFPPGTSTGRPFSLLKISDQLINYITILFKIQNSSAVFTLDH